MTKDELDLVQTEDLWAALKRRFKSCVFVFEMDPGPSSPGVVIDFRYRDWSASLGLLTWAQQAIQSDYTTPPDDAPDDPADDDDGEAWKRE